MPSIKTLVRDIEGVLTKGVEVPRAAFDDFGGRLSEVIAQRLSRREDRTSLRASNLGTPCDRKLWYSIHTPEDGEKLPASTIFKFLFGAIIEEVTLFLARLAGHEVKNEQLEVNIHGVLGHIDGTIDGELVDVKSASTPSFRKFSNHGLEVDDPFGYLVQLGSYGSVVGEGSNHFLAVDKTMGHIVLDTWPKSRVDFKRLVEAKQAMLAKKIPPERGFQDEKYQEGGNRKLGLNCSYCDFKAKCWPGLRAFVYKSNYGDKIVYLTRVLKEPKVDEIEVSRTGND